MAQRSYRNRKQNALASAQARASKLEKALESTLQSLNGFQQYVAQNGEGRVPADVLLQLTKAAADISAAARQAQSDDGLDLNNMEGLTESYSQTLSDTANKTMSARNSAVEVTPIRNLEPNIPHNIMNVGFVDRKSVDPDSLAHRMLHACFQRYRASIAKGVSGELGVLSVLIMALHPTPDYKCLEIRLKPTYDMRKGYWSDIEHPESTKRALPKAFRIVEGEYGARAPRRPPPNLQRLRFGRTRTILQTDLIEMQGEWLEACDVEEYLAERGIYVRGNNSSSVLELGISPHGDAMSLDEGASHSTEYNYALTDNALATMDHANLLSHKDYTIFGRRMFDRPLPSGMASLELSSRQYADLAETLESGHQSHFLPNRASQHPLLMERKVTIDLEKLVSVLADNATCLGLGPGVRRSAVDLAIRESMLIQ